jgi:hypothetical protein
MARAAFVCTLRTTFPGNGGYAFASGSAAPQPSQAAVEAAVAVLEADGASPTQAHVTSLRAAWDTLVTALGVYGGGDALLDFNASTLTTQNAVRAALREFERAVAGSGLARG